MNLNLGAGEFHAPGYLNVDRFHPLADVSWDITENLPWIEDSIDRIYAGHVLEHLPLDTLPGVLGRWREDPSVHERTELAVVGPDCDRAAQMFRDGKLDTEDLRLIREGGDRWEGDRHLWRSTEFLTLRSLRIAGWTAQPVTPLELACKGWPVVSLAGWQFAILATP
jgi:hypothetical protein